MDVECLTIPCMLGAVSTARRDGVRSTYRSVIDIERKVGLLQLGEWGIRYADRACSNKLRHHFCLLVGKRDQFRINGPSRLVESESLGHNLSPLSLHGTDKVTAWLNKLDQRLVFAFEAVTYRRGNALTSGRDHIVTEADRRTMQKVLLPYASSRDSLLATKRLLTLPHQIFNLPHRWVVRVYLYHLNGT